MCEETQWTLIRLIADAKKMKMFFRFLRKSEKSRAKARHQKDNFRLFEESEESNFQKIFIDFVP